MAISTIADNAYIKKRKKNKVSDNFTGYYQLVDNKPQETFIWLHFSTAEHLTQCLKCD